MRNQTLQRLVAIAYAVTDDRVLGGPRWSAFDGFDVEARAIGPAREPELLQMLQQLLAERFQLVVHREKKNTSGFSLTAKGGLKIHPDETQGQPVWNSSKGKIIAQRISMETLAVALTRLLGTPVIDQTNAKGRYSFTLEWTPEARSQAVPESAQSGGPTGPSLDEVIAQQLGIKLERKKLPIEVIVIDRAEKPTEN